MKGICDVCGRQRTVHRNCKSGKAICHNCGQMARYRDPSTHERCFECGKVKPVAMHNEFGKAICHACYQRSKVDRCAECKETKVIQALGRCYGCYQRQRRVNMAARPA